MKQYSYYLRIQCPDKKWHSSERFSTLQELVNKYGEWIQNHPEYPFQIAREYKFVSTDGKSQ